MKIECFFSTFLVMLAGATGAQRASAQEPAQPLTASVAFQGSATAILGSKEMPFGFSIRCSGGRCRSVVVRPQYRTLRDGNRQGTAARDVSYIC
jgi:hypothetical protein